MYLYIPPRVVTFLCFLQVFFVVFGYLVTCSCIRVGGATHVDVLLAAVQAYGPWCLAVPFIWGPLTVGCIRTNRESLLVTKWMFGAGLILTLMLFFAFSTAVVDSLVVCFGHLHA